MVLGVFIVYASDNVDSTGQVFGVWDIGVVIYTCILITVTLKLCLETNNWTFFHVIAYGGSVFTYIVWLLFWNIIYGWWPFPRLSLGAEVHFSLYKLGGTAAFYFVLLLVPIAALVRDFAWKALYRMFLPRLYHIAQEVTVRPLSPQHSKSSHYTGFAFSQTTEAGVVVHGTHGKKY
eukprot:TRINITY_DN2620_c0_g1_i1.p1 TRINITY_DN2620_c0_g1~~TRINITY_DN2620_c0_g1_i1.p1  ORF type:complete len:177 (-),score=14.97 TRINITY_DN2620_c0_g1_i1:31-561(-)